MTKQSEKTTFHIPEETPRNSTAADLRQSPARRPRLLRRWRVADLIAQAAARPPAASY